MNSRSLFFPGNPSGLDSTSRELEDLRRERSALKCQLEEERKINETLMRLLKTKEEIMQEFERGPRDDGDLPTDRERRLAMQLLGFVEKHLHIAIVGVPGVGKSSLVNAFRGLTDRDSYAAKAGVNEAIDRIIRYPDLGYRNVIYYDVPAVRTVKLSGYDYFMDQGLFVMDAIILAWCDRLTDTDIDIMKNCIKLKIPFFLIRTKCDQYISNFRDDVRDEYEYDENDRRFIEAMYEKISQFLSYSSLAAIDGIRRAYVSAGFKPPPNEQAKEHVFFVSRKSLVNFARSGEEDENALHERLLMDRIDRLRNDRNLI